MENRAAARIFAWNGALVLLCLTIFASSASAIICYRCVVVPATYYGEPDQPCSKFDGSSRFYKDCPQSTLCEKRITHFRLGNGSIVTTAERDCANQKYTEQEFNYDNKKWHTKNFVDTEAYQTGCFKGENRGSPSGASEYCYCSSNYCNGSSILTNRFSFLVIALTFIVKFS